MPIAFMMGVEPKDCRIVAELVGTKTFINEFVAYDKLSDLIKNRINDIEPQLSVGFVNCSDLIVYFTYKLKITWIYYENLVTQFTVVLSLALRRLAIL